MAEDPKDELPESLRNEPPEAERLGVPKVEIRTLATTARQNRVVEQAKKLEAEDRRKKVQSLLLRGLTITNIAQLLKVQPKTVKSDITAIKRANLKKIDDFQQELFVGESFAVFEELIEQGWKEFLSNKEGDARRIKALDFIRTTANDKIRLLKETGMVKTEGEHVTVTHTFDIPWDDATQRKVAMALLQEKLTPQLAAPTPDFEHESGKNIPDAEIITEDNNDEEK